MHLWHDLWRCFCTKLCACDTVLVQDLWQKIKWNLSASTKVICHLSKMISQSPPPRISLDLLKTLYDLWNIKKLAYWQDRWLRFDSGSNAIRTNQIKILIERISSGDSYKNSKNIIKYCLTYPDIKCFYYKKRKWSLTNISSYSYLLHLIPVKLFSNCYWIC